MMIARRGCSRELRGTGGWRFVYSGNENPLRSEHVWCLIDHDHHLLGVKERSNEAGSCMRRQIDRV